MVDDAEADALGRLEAALDRIAVRARTPTLPGVEPGAIAARLDRLIGQLQDALSDDADAAHDITHEAVHEAGV